MDQRCCQQVLLLLPVEVVAVESVYPAVTAAAALTCLRMLKAMFASTTE